MLTKMTFWRLVRLWIITVALSIVTAQLMTTYGLTVSAGYFWLRLVVLMGIYIIPAIVIVVMGVKATRPRK